MEELGKGWVGETTRASIGIFDYVINWVSNISMFSDPETKVYEWARMMRFVPICKLNLFAVYLIRFPCIDSYLNPIPTPTATF